MATDLSERLQADLLAAEEYDRGGDGGDDGGRSDDASSTTRGRDFLANLYTRAVPVLARQVALDGTKRFVQERTRADPGGGVLEQEERRLPVQEQTAAAAGGAPLSVGGPPVVLLPLRQPRPKRVYQKRSRGPENPGLKSVPIDVMRRHTNQLRRQGRVDTLPDGRVLDAPVRKRLKRQVRLNAQIQQEQEIVAEYKELADDVLGGVTGPQRLADGTAAGRAHGPVGGADRCLPGEWARLDDDDADDAATVEAAVAMAAAAAHPQAAAAAAAEPAVFPLCSRCHLPTNRTNPRPDLVDHGPPVWWDAKADAPLPVLCAECSGPDTECPRGVAPMMQELERTRPARGGGGGSSYLPLGHLGLHITHMEGAGCTAELLDAVRRRAIGYRLLDPAGNPWPPPVPGVRPRPLVTQQHVVQMIAAEGFQSLAYAYAPYVRSRLWGTPLHTLTPAQKLLLRKAFIMHRVAYFQLSKQHGWAAKNGPPVQFLCCKLGELLGFNDWAGQCRLYGTTDHRNQAEHRWQMVREFWGWPFYSTALV